MSDDFSQAAAGLSPERLQQQTYQMMARIVITVEGAVRERTHVRTGLLRRSWTHLVESTGQRGIVGTNISYAPYQVNDPLGEGWDAAYQDALAIARAAGVRFLSGAVKQ